MNVAVWNVVHALLEPKAQQNEKKPIKTNTARFHISPEGLSNPTHYPNDVHALVCINK